MYALGTLDVVQHKRVRDARLRSRWLEVADGIAETCVQMYKQMPSGLMPEHVTLYSDSSMRSGAGWAAHNLQRPETVETLFYMWRLTHDQKYREWAWEPFQQFQAKARVEHGYTGLTDVTEENGLAKDNRMHSWWLGETLKYLYLTFSDDSLLPLDEVVFNTEAHPLRIFSKTWTNWTFPA